MSELSIPWRPRVIMVGRAFRLPVQSAEGPVELCTEHFDVISSRWEPRDKAWYYYLRSPEHPGDYTITVRQNGQSDQTVIQVRTLDQLRGRHEYNGAVWPRRWPVGQPWESAKQRQTLQVTAPLRPVDEEQLAWWTGQTDQTLWHQMPWPEFPQAHFVNVNQGCPNCRTGVFRFGGFYPWTRNHLPCDFRSTCPSCGIGYPSNDFMAGDFTGGNTADDGFGYFDQEGHIYLFTATYHRDQVNRMDTGIRHLTNRLRAGPFEEGIARQLTVLLLRYATDILYVAAVPQFRYGPSMGQETPWTWGQPDWASEPDPLEALYGKGMRRYSIDIPYVSESLALAYDTIWPFLKNDTHTVDRAQALGVNVRTPDDVIVMIEEMLAAQVQNIMDRGGHSNLPRESMGTLSLLRGLDRPDAQDVMDWLYDEGPDRMRVFGINDFFPDGTPPEATGGYNGIHTNGLFALEHHMRHLRKLHPDAYPESRYPSLVADPRAARVAREPHEVTMIGKSWYQFGDGSAPGCKDEFGPGSREDSIVLRGDVLVSSRIEPDTLDRAAEYTDDPVVKEMVEAADEERHRTIGTTIHDGGGIAILRTPETPERAALGIVYGDTTGHRHMDLLDVQLLAFERPFLTDLGYPQSWASIERWEAHWSTHNTAWGIVPGVSSQRIAGRGKLIRTLFVDGIQILEIEAERWVAEEDDTGIDQVGVMVRRFGHRWRKPGVTFRRLLALIETDGDGILVVDLARVRGGTEHWRMCRGLQGTFASSDLEFTPRSGNVADPKRPRGDDEALAHPDYAGLAWMDDVSETECAGQCRGRWQSREAGVYLDLYQTGVSSDTTLISARATATMGAPEESRYAYRTLLWRRQPKNSDDTTSVDIVMEPRVGEATVDKVRGIPVTEGDCTGSGIALSTKAGKSIAIYWAPENGNRESTFEDGTVLRGGLGVFSNGTAILCGDSVLSREGTTHRGLGTQTGRISALNRDKRKIEVSGLLGVEAGDRIRINPNGRGHNYEVEAVESLENGAMRLILDVTSLLGRAPVVAVNGDKIDLGMSITARTGNLNQTRLLMENTHAAISDAVNPNRESTIVWVEDAAAVAGLATGDWLDVVDYVVGDEVVFEPVVVR